MTHEASLKKMNKLRWEKYVIWEISIYNVYFYEGGGVIRERETKRKTKGKRKQYNEIY